MRSHPNGVRHLRQHRVICRGERQVVQRTRTLPLRNLSLKEAHIGQCAVQLGI
jgi:hypothetical protein